MKKNLLRLAVSIIMVLTLTSVLGASTAFGASVRTITVTAPAGGENWVAGSTHNMTWTSVGVSREVRIQVSSDSGATWKTIVRSNRNTGTFAWKVSGAATTHARVRISTSGDRVVSGSSAADFSILPSAPRRSPVPLGLAADFAILTKTGISTTGTTSIVGNVGVSPAAATYITGFGLIMDSSNQFSRSSLVTGRVYAANYAVPTPTYMTTAISNMQTAYTNAAGRTLPDYTELGAGNIGGMTLAPGLYKWGTGVTIPANVTLSGGSNDVWIFQIAQTLTVGSGVRVNLAGGAQAKNIFWQVAGQTTLGTTSVVNGNILCQTAIVFNNGARLNGRALAQTAVTLIANSIVKPAP